MGAGSGGLPSDYNVDPYGPGGYQGFENMSGGYSPY
jgi:hypothetical protein